MTLLTNAWPPPASRLAWPAFAGYPLASSLSFMSIVVSVLVVSPKCLGTFAGVSGALYGVVTGRNVLSTPSSSVSQSSRLNVRSLGAGARITRCTSSSTYCLVCCSGNCLACARRASVFRFVGELISDLQISRRTHAELSVRADHFLSLIHFSEPRD